MPWGWNQATNQINKDRQRQELLNRANTMIANSMMSPRTNTQERAGALVGMLLGNLLSKWGGGGGSGIGGSVGSNGDDTNSAISTGAIYADYSPNNDQTIGGRNSQTPDYFGLDVNDIANDVIQQQYGYGGGNSRLPYGWPGSDDNNGFFRRR